MRARTNVYHLECFACQQCNHRYVELTLSFLFPSFSLNYTQIAHFDRVIDFRRYIMHVNVSSFYGHLKRIVFPFFFFKYVYK